MIWQPAILAWPSLIAQLLIFGTAAFALAFDPSGIAPGSDREAALIALWRALAIVILIASPFEFMEMTATMASMQWREAIPFVPQVLAGTHAGHVWIWRFGAIVLIAIASWMPARGIVVAWAMLALSGLLIALSGLAGHAIDGGAFAVVADFLHMAAVAVWIGALASMLMAARVSGAAHESIEAAAPLVSRLSGWTVAVIAITGLFNAWERLGLHWHLLIDSIYGRTLLWKLAIAAPVLIIAAYNRYRLVPAIAAPSARAILIRNVALECILLAAVIGCSAALANTPPPH